MKEEIRENKMKEEIIEEKLYFCKYTISNIKDALKDENQYIRLEAYRILGYTKDAFKDEYSKIRLEAKLYFEIKEKMK